MSIYLQHKVRVNAPEFAEKVQLMGKALQVDPDYLMAVMYHESKLDSTIKNPTPGSTATGLIQFVERTAKGLGTTTAALRQMSNVQQLEYVYGHLKPFAGKMNDLTETYFAVFYP